MALVAVELDSKVEASMDHPGDRLGEALEALRVAALVLLAVGIAMISSVKGLVGMKTGIPSGCDTSSSFFPLVPLNLWVFAGRVQPSSLRFGFSFHPSAR